MRVILSRTAFLLGRHSDYRWVVDYTDIGLHSRLDHHKYAVVFFTVYLFTQKNTEQPGVFKKNIIKSKVDLNFNCMTACIELCETIDMCSSLAQSICIQTS